MHQHHILTKQIMHLHIVNSSVLKNQYLHQLWVHASKDDQTDDLTTR